MSNKDKQLESKFMESKPDWLTDSLGTGIEIGFDPLGTLYSVITKNYSGTRGGSSYKHPNFTSKKAKFAKLSGAIMGLTANIASYGLCQAAYTILDLDRLACQYIEKRKTANSI